MRRFVLVIALAVLLALLAAPVSAKQGETIRPCAKPITAKQLAPFSAKVWDRKRWRRGAPKPSTARAYKRKLDCAAGPGHRRAMANRWSRDRSRYGQHRNRQRYCRSGNVIEGRVSWFNGPASTTASGTPVSTPGLALNLAPGTTSAGWSNPTTRYWMALAAAGRPQLARTTIAGRSAVLPIIDLGPHEITHRAIDVTEAGVHEMGWSDAYSFPTDAIGRVKLIPPGC